MAEKRVIVYRTTDPIQADMLGALLRENGIAACVLGTRHGAAIGVSQHILDLYIEVPQAQAGSATDFLEAFFDSDGAALLAEHAGFAPSDGDGDEDAGEPSGAAGAASAASDEADDHADDQDRPRGPGTWALAVGVAALVAGAVMVVVAALLGAWSAAESNPTRAPHGAALVPAAQPAH
ncbi:MAG TPA: DUF2007 domain-containing protein [Haliangium sp.]|nr:DUF2007 domain-containing protein [Haliangium sp.]